MDLPSLPIIVAAALLWLVYRFISDYREISRLEKHSTDTETKLKQETANSARLAAELDELKQQFTHNVIYDSLTGLPGRQVYYDRLLQTFNQSSRYQLSFGVMFLDLDGFKIINEALGHDVGDELLKEVAVRLEGTIRQVDTISRFAGDEFVFILPQLSKPETAAYVAQRLLNVISQPFVIRGQELYVTASIGIATYPLDGDTTAVLLKNAGNALHQAKTRGRNNYQFYREEMHTLSQRELILSSSLQHKDIYQDFSLLYQPEVNVINKEVVCMQALLHWKHPDFGLIALPEFLTLAENCSKINEIGDWVLRNALQQLKKWQTQKFFPRAISIPVSLRQLENPHFTYKAAQLLQELKLDPSMLVLEISESILHKMELVEKVAHMLKHMGVQIAIKDFGAGNLALQHLKRFPIDYLKISSVLTQDITINKESEAIVKMILALAKTLQITAVAAGVESPKQKVMLIELGCQIMEGHLFSAPLGAEEFTDEKIQAFLAS